MWMAYFGSSRRLFCRVGCVQKEAGFVLYIKCITCQIGWTCMITSEGDVYVSNVSAELAGFASRKQRVRHMSSTTRYIVAFKA